MASLVDEIENKTSALVLGEDEESNETKIESSEVSMKSTKTVDCSPEKLQAIEEDHAFIEEFLPPAAIVTLNKDFVTVVIIRTAYSRVQLRIQYTTQYPSEIPIIELSSSTLPMPLLRNKEKECADKARDLLCKPQVRAIYEHIYKFIQTNMFIPCWKEIKQVM